jgi:hypothetical protein
MPKHSSVDVDDDMPDWSSYTVPELKIELELRGLPKSGRKADLIARLDAQVSIQSSPSVGPALDTSSAPSATRLVNRTPKSKKARIDGPGILIEGPLASEVIRNHRRNPETGEVRLREYVPAPDAKFRDKFRRIHQERMFMLDRRTAYDTEGYQSEVFTIAGSTGNIYTCSIGRKPKCDCMDAVSCTVLSIFR